MRVPSLRVPKLYEYHSACGLGRERISLGEAQRLGYTEERVAACADTSGYKIFSNVHGRRSRKSLRSRTNRDDLSYKSPRTETRQIPTNF